MSESESAQTVKGQIRTLAARGIKSYTVEYVMPVDNPENNVRIKRGKGGITFYLPTNYPDAHMIGLAELLLRAEQSGLLALSIPLNKNSLKLSEEISSKECVSSVDRADRARE